MGDLMSSLIVSGDTSGAITLSAPAVAGSGVLTLPVTTDTLVGRATTDTLTNKTLGSTVVQASNAAPAFSAYQSSAQTLGTAATKINFQTEEWDTNSNFASSTFTPTVAGYYTVNAAIQMGSSFTTGNLSIYKNGSLFKNGFSTGTSGVTGIFTVACQVSLNGSTDYIECYGTIGTGQALVPSSATTYFQAAMIRSA
jgi:hypothetical protein